MSKKFKAVAIDMAGLIGLASMAFGVHKIYPPAAFIVVGILLMTYAVKKAD